MTRAVALTLALVATMVPRPAEAELFREWFVCGGGDAFQTCGAVQVTVGNAAGGVSPVLLKIWNASGYSGTYNNSVFTAVGFFDDYQKTAGGVSVVSGSEVMSGPVRGTDTPGAWIGVSDKQVGGGVWLELAGTTENGVHNSIASGCANALPGGSNELWMNPCYNGTFVDAGWVSLGFNINGAFDPNNYELLIKAQNGLNGGSTECITGTGTKANCPDEPPCIIGVNCEEPPCIPGVNCEEPPCIPGVNCEEPPCIPGVNCEEPPCIPGVNCEEPPCIPGVNCEEPPCIPGVNCEEPPCIPGVNCEEPPCTPGVNCEEPPCIPGSANCTDTVPEPVTTVLLGSGLAAMAAARLRKKKDQDIDNVI